MFKTSKENLTNKDTSESKITMKEENKEESNSVENLNSNIKLNKQEIDKLQTKNTDLNTQLDKLEKKVDCITAGNESHANAVKTKIAQQKKTKKYAKKNTY
jgi:outer membrane murein-binding lipoprotein Lpp